MAHETQRRIRVGIDTGGTFTDVVAFDEDTGELVTTKTPSHPRQPGRRVHRRHREDPRRARRDRRRHHRRLPRHHRGDQQAARGQGRAAGLHHHRGLRVHARDRPAGRTRRLRQLVLLGQAAAHRRRPTGCAPSAAGWTSRATRCGPSTRSGRRGRRALVPRPAASPRSACASCTPTPTPSTSWRCARCCAASTPRPWSRSSREVLREYREYERSMTTLVDAAVKPNVSRYVSNIARPARRLHRRPADPVLRDEVQRRRALGRRGGAPADHHRAVRAGRRGAGGGADRPAGRLRPGAHLRRRRHLDRRLGRARRRADADHRGHGRRLPEQDPDDRRRDGRCRRRLDRLGDPRGDAQGRAAVGRRRPRAALLRPGRHRADDHRRPPRARPDPAAPARR